MLRRNAALIVLLAVSASRAGAATVAGKVTLAGAGKDRADASNTVVWIEGAHAAGGAAKGEMKSSSKRFDPRVVAVSKNATVEFPNCRPDLPQRVLGLGRQPLRPRALPQRLLQVEDLRRGRGSCASTATSTRRWSASSMVVDSDFVAVTGPDGAFRFDSVPPGPHVVKAWNEQGSRSFAARHGQGRATTTRSRSASTSRASSPSRTRTSTARTTPRNAGASNDERY